MRQDGTGKQEERGSRGVSCRWGIAAGVKSEVWSQTCDIASVGEGTSGRARDREASASGDQGDAEGSRTAAAGAVRGTSEGEAIRDDDRGGREGARSADPKKIWGQVVTLVRESEGASQQTLCRLLGHSRQGYYKLERREEREAFKAELVISEVVKIRSVQPRIGVRKIYHMIQPFLAEHGVKAGRDQLNELMREHALLVRKRRSRKPKTTISCWWRRYPNLIRDFVAGSANQVWVSDITYIRIGERFGFLSLITDAYSRRIVGYKLFRDLSARGCVAALKMAIRNNPSREALIHHSDRGMQYSSSEYVRLLGTARISMTEKGDPLENAIAERVNGILKDELLQKQYDTFKEAREAIARAVDIYNHLRPHSSIENLTPDEAHTRSGQLKRLWKNYYSNRTIAQASA